MIQSLSLFLQHQQTTLSQDILLELNGSLNIHALR